MPRHQTECGERGTSKQDPQRHQPRDALRRMFEANLTFDPSGWIAVVTTTRTFLDLWRYVTVTVASARSLCVLFIDFRNASVSTEGDTPSAVQSDSAHTAY